MKKIYQKPKITCIVFKEFCLSDSDRTIIDVGNALKNGQFIE